MTAILPSSLFTPEVKESLLDSIYYQVQKLPVYRLLEPDFLSTFVRKGHLDARTTGTWQEVDQFAVFDSGKLNLYVNKDIYQELGLNAQKDQIFIVKSATKYCN